MPAVLAAYELRFLIAHVSRLTVVVGSGATIHSLAPVALLLLAAGVSVILREAASGLCTRFRRPASSASLLGFWLLCSAVLGVVLGSFELAYAAIAREPVLGHALMSGGWATAAPAVVLAGLLLAVSLQGARWLFVRVRHLLSRLWLVRRRAPKLRIVVVNLGAAATPLRDGWSDRGPPVIAPAA